MHQSNVVNKAAVLLLMAGLFIGCSKTETPVSTTTTVTASKIAVCYVANFYGIFYSGARLVSDPVADINNSNTILTWGDTLNSITYQKNQIQGGIEFGFDTTHNYLDTTLTMQVVSNVGICQGSIQIPESTFLYTPSYWDTLPIGSVTCYWARAARADWYWVSYWAQAFDTSWNYLGYNENIISVATDTTITIPGSFFNVSNANFYYVTFEVYPLCGPLVQAGAIGNMTGTIKGFLNAEGWYGYTCFYAGTPTKGVKNSKREYKAPSPKVRMDKYLQMITGQ